MKLDSSLSAVVTGGASGLGLATVRALREAGVKVANHLPSNLAFCVFHRKVLESRAKPRPG